MIGSRLITVHEEVNHSIFYRIQIATVVSETTEKPAGALDGYIYSRYG